MDDKTIKSYNRHKRADTPEKKREVIEKLFHLWLKYPELRLGQLIDNSLFNDIVSLYNVEDFDLVRHIEYFDRLREEA